MQIDELRREARTIEARYGLTPPPELLRLYQAEQRRLYRIRHLLSLIEDYQVEVGRMRTEIEGLEVGMRLALQDFVDTARKQHREAWSPTPVVGYRFWFVHEGAVHGYRVPWTTPRLTAVCGQGSGNDEVPHTDGRCGDPACGIYVAKDPVALLDAHPDRPYDWLVGMVELSGKVVEHEHGYRGQHAQTVAVVAFRGHPIIDGRRAYTSADPAAIEAFFANPADPSVLDHRGRGREVEVVVNGFFWNILEGREPWT